MVDEKRIVDKRRKQIVFASAWHRPAEGWGKELGGFKNGDLFPHLLGLVFLQEKERQSRCTMHHIIDAGGWGAVDVIEDPEWIVRCAQQQQHERKCCFENKAINSIFPQEKRKGNLFFGKTYVYAMNERAVSRSISHVAQVIKIAKSTYVLIDVKHSKTLLV